MFEHGCHFHLTGKGSPVYDAGMKTVMSGRPASVINRRYLRRLMALFMSLVFVLALTAAFTHHHHHPLGLAHAHTQDCSLCLLAQRLSQELALLVVVGLLALSTSESASVLRPAKPGPSASTPVSLKDRMDN